MVRRKIEEINYTCIECLLYTFHHLAHKVRVLISWTWIILLPDAYNQPAYTFPFESDRLQMPQTVSVGTRLSLDNHQIDWGRISRSNIRTLLRGASTCSSIPWCCNSSQRCYAWLMPIKIWSHFQLLDYWNENSCWTRKLDTGLQFWHSGLWKAT